MHSYNLKMIKITMVILTISMIIIMVTGISILRNNFYFREKFLALEWDYIKTKIYYIEYSHNNPAQKNNTPSKFADSVPILLYHGVIEDSNWKPDDVSIRLDDFRSQLFALKRAGWQTISIEDYLAFTQGKKKLPDKSFMITFDDGRKDSYYHADPILRTLGYSAVMNIITGRSLSQDSEKSSFHLSQMELEKMIASGRWQLESHGRYDHDYQKIDANGKDGHFLSDKLWLPKEGRIETNNEFKNRTINDLAGSKNDLEKKLNIKVLAFAYPFGDFGQATQNFPESKSIILNATKQIYPLSFIQAGNSDFTDNYQEDSFLSRRISVNSFISSDDLLKTLSDAESKPIDYADYFSKNNGWIRGWGTMSMGKNSMVISDSETEDSGMAFLNGTYLWKDYYAQSQAKVSQGDDFALMARYKDENNYVSCDFSNDHVAVTERVLGIDQPDSEVTASVGIGAGKEIHPGIYVSANQATCYLDGKPLVSGPIDQSLKNGGISFKIWDTFSKNSTLTVSSLRVSSAP